MSPGSNRRAADGCVVFQSSVRFDPGDTSDRNDFAGVVRVDFLLAVIALMDMASKKRRAAGGNIPQSEFLDRAQTDAGLFSIRCAVEADDIGHLRHKDPVSKVFHEFIERIGLSCSHLAVKCV